MSDPIQIRPLAMDHIVLKAADVEQSLTFYCDGLGLEPMKVEEWRAGKAHFPSVRINETTIIDLVEGTSAGNNLDHFCIVIEAVDFEELIASRKLDVQSGPVIRSGARGDGLSIYVLDPDHNQVELRYY